MIGTERREEHMRQISILAVLMAFGCGSLDHKDYTLKRGAAECGKYATCAKGYYESEFRDIDDCIDDLSDDLDDRSDTIFDNCEYDGNEASSCVSRIRNLSCEDFSEGDAQGACDLVWDCR